MKSAPANSSYRECTRWCTPVTITPAGTITAVPISRPTYFRDCELEAGAVTVTRDRARRRAMIGARGRLYECWTVTLTVDVAARLPASETLTQ